MREVYAFEKIKKKTIELPRNLFKCVKLNFDAIILKKKYIWCFDTDSWRYKNADCMTIFAQFY